MCPGGAGGGCNGAGSCLRRSRTGCFSDTATARDAAGDARRHTGTGGDCEGAGSRSAPSTKKQKRAQLEMAKKNNPALLYIST